MIIGGKKFDVENETYVMGILNVTPDSFSDGGKYNGMDQAMEHARQMVEDGADIIDVGGESTRPGHIMITDEEEIARVTPIIEKLKKEFDVPISIDTYKSKVAEAAVQAGADLVNDIWGLKYDEKIADVIAKHNVACCLMHNRDNTEYSNFLDDFMEDMRECIRLAKAAGIADDKIILDPGVGFGKTYEMNLEIIRNHAEAQLPNPSWNFQKIRHWSDTESASRSAGRRNTRDDGIRCSKRQCICACP